MLLSSDPSTLKSFHQKRDVRLLAAPNDTPRWTAAQPWR